MKKIYLILLLLYPLFGLTQSATISGVVTYFFNQYVGDRPDIGAKVYIINSENNPDFNYNTVDSFIHAKTYRGIYLGYLKIYSRYEDLAKEYEGKRRLADIHETYKAKANEAKKDVDNYYVKVSNYGIDTDEKFNLLDSRTVKSLIIINEENSILKTVDGSGNYSINVKPGTYYILIVSKGRTGTSASEVMGKIYCKKVTINDNETKNVSKNFDLY